MKKAIKNTNDFMLSILMGTLSVFLLVSDQTVSGKSNGMGGFWAQASTYIALLAAGLLALSVLQLLYAVDFRGNGARQPLGVPINREIVVTAVALVLYALLLPSLTFFPATLALNIILCGTFMMKENSGDGSRRLSKKQIFAILVYSAVLTVLLYVVFTKLLKCVLP